MIWHPLRPDSNLRPAIFHGKIWETCLWLVHVLDQEPKCVVILSCAIGLKCVLLSGEEASRFSMWWIRSKLRRPCRRPIRVATISHDSQQPYDYNNPNSLWPTSTDPNDSDSSFTLPFGTACEAPRVYKVSFIPPGLEHGTYTFLIDLRSF